LFHGAPQLLEAILWRSDCICDVPGDRFERKRIALCAIAQLII
jgi:hypothetical protein